MDIEYDWPDSFPEGVPPDQATPCNGIFFRFTFSNPPIKNDFLQYRDEEDNKDKDFTGFYLITSYGMSFFDDLQAAISKKNLYKNRLGDSYIAKGELVPDLGKMTQTFKSNHHTAWMQKNAEPHKLNWEIVENESTSD